MRALLHQWNVHRVAARLGEPAAPRSAADSMVIGTPEGSLHSRVSAIGPTSLAGNHCEPERGRTGAIMKLGAMMVSDRRSSVRACLPSLRRLCTE